eukprot:15440048-Alexandrium_andersonii.AAC.2
MTNMRSRHSRLHHRAVKHGEHWRKGGHWSGTPGIRRIPGAPPERRGNAHRWSSKIDRPATVRTAEYAGRNKLGRQDRESRATSPFQGKSGGPARSARMRVASTNTSAKSQTARQHTKGGLPTPRDGQHPEPHHGKARGRPGGLRTPRSTRTGRPLGN